MIRRFTPVALVATLVLAACGAQGAPRMEDPKEILTKAVEAMADVDSVRFLAELDGEFDVAEMGGSMSLNGTELEGAIAMDGSAGWFTFAVPAFLGLNGELRLVDGLSFMRSSMTGPLWVRSEVSEDPDDPLAQAADPQVALDELRAFLDEEGVTLEKQDDVDCGDGTCYHLALTISAEMLAENAEDVDAFGGDVTEVFADGLTFDILVDTSTLYLAGVSTAIEAEAMGSLSFTVTFDGYGDAVEVEAPPADEVTDEPGGFTLP